MLIDVYRNALIEVYSEELLKMQKCRSEQESQEQRKKNREESIQQFSKTQKWTDQNKVDTWKTEVEEGQATIRHMTDQCGGLGTSVVVWRLQNVLTALQSKQKRETILAIKQFDKEDLSHMLNEPLLFPRELWLTRSPCSDCTKILIKAYAHLQPPTICIGEVYKKNPDNIAKLRKHSFNITRWDLCTEYRNWIVDFKNSECYRVYVSTKNGKCMYL